MTKSKWSGEGVAWAQQMGQWALGKGSLAWGDACMCLLYNRNWLFRHRTVMEEGFGGVIPDIITSISVLLCFFSVCFFRSQSHLFPSGFPYLGMVYLVFLKSSLSCYPSSPSSPPSKTLSTRNMSLIFTDPDWNWFMQVPSKCQVCTKGRLPHLWKKGLLLVSFYTIFSNQIKCSFGFKIGSRSWLSLKTENYPLSISRFFRC